MMFDFLYLTKEPNKKQEQKTVPFDIKRLCIFYIKKILNVCKLTALNE